MAKFIEYSRVISFVQLLYLFGRKLKRQGIRYTTLAVIICGSVILVDIAGNRILNFDLPWKSADMAAIPGIVALLTFGIGNLFVCISNMFSTERMLIADANSMNLMEDRKKADIQQHLEVLWDRVFKYESKLKNTRKKSDETEFINSGSVKFKEFISSLDPQYREYLGINEDCIDQFMKYVSDFRTLSGKIPVTKEEFISVASLALRKALPQKLQEFLSGCDLSLIEDWYDGAFFNINDCKLQEQYDANKTIRAIRETVGIDLSVKIKETLLGHPLPLWHVLTMKKIGISVGTLMAKMNKKYVRPDEPEFFDAQHFLWESEQNDNLIKQVCGEQAFEDVYQSRKKLFRDIFSNDKRTAHAHIYRMFGRDFINAMNLRLDYDVEFAAGILDNTPIRDIRNLNEVMLHPVYSEEKCNLKIKQICSELEEVDDFLKRNVPEIFNNLPILRTARICSVLNQFDLRRLMRENPNQAISVFREKVVASEHRYTKRICLLRQHYELARLQLLCYLSMINELAEFDDDS